MSQITILLPKKYFTRISKAATVIEWKDVDNECCEITLDGISDPGELVLLGMFIANDDYVEKANEILNNALKQLQP